ncbi:glycosyltransferase [Patescibacteria group bacterium]|nr:glycosyltransferase [Patescibacteria group bacterium]
MKVAILHDYLNQFGGAERVLKVILEIFPEADIYTLLYDKEKTNGLFDKNIKKTSFLDIPFVRSHHRMFIPFMPLASNLLKSKEDYDLVFSSTAGYGKGFNVKGGYHISYCHTPLRYAWEIDYLKNLSFSPKELSNLIAYPIAKFMRNWDKNASKSVNLFIANSSFIAEKIKSYYGRDAVVVNPPVNLKTFFPESDATKKDYYLMVGRLLYYKGFDTGIAAFNRMKYPLKIVGRGPELDKLKKMVKSLNIEFITEASDKDLRKLYSNAKALIFPQIEDFGLVAAEAEACGTPVIAYEKGGIKDIVANKKTGLFFSEQTPEAIIEAVKDFENMHFPRNLIAKSAERFSKENFMKNILKVMMDYGIRV